MAMKPSAFDALLDKYDAEILQAFEEAVQDLRNAADVDRVVKALANGDIAEAIAALHLEPAALSALTDKIDEAYDAAGKQTASALPTIRDAAGAKFVIRFDGRNLRAESWLRDHSSELVTRILDDQRVAIRAALTEGMQLGVNPRTTALNIIGRIDPQSKRRVGGIVGLSSQQEQFVESARRELASADPALLRNYLARGRRDARFDTTVLKAIANNEAVPADIAAKAVGRYSDRLLQLRGEGIARTESLTSLHAAQEEAYQQAIDKGAITANQVRNTWRTAGDSRVRETHRAMNGETVEQGGVFVSPSGAQLRFPGDTSLGAGPEEVINCRCFLQKRIDFLANIQ